MAKLFEKMVLQQIMSYLQENEILTKYQSVFRKGHSTLTAFIGATDNWLVTIDQGLINGVVFLDLKKPIGSAFVSRLNSDLNKILKWLLANILALNVSKTEYMIVVSRQRISQIVNDPKVTVGGKDLKRVRSAKSLDVITDDKLKWEEQIDSISKKVSKRIGELVE